MMMMITTMMIDDDGTNPSVNWHHPYQHGTATQWLTLTFDKPEHWFKPDFWVYRLSFGLKRKFKTLDLANVKVTQRKLYIMLTVLNTEI